MTKIVVEAPGKLIWLGEYAVLEGAPAVVTAVNRAARTSISARPKDDSFLVNAPVLDITKQPFHLEGESIVFPNGITRETRKALHFFATTLEKGLENLKESGLALDPCEFHLDTGAFFLGNSGIKLGFGSSAALSVSLLGAMMSAAGQELFIQENQLLLFETAMTAHHQAQGKMGSGIDIAASTFGGLLRYQLMPETLTTPTLIEELPFPENIKPVYIWTGHSASTTSLVGKVYQFRDTQPTAYDQIIKDMYELGEAGCLALESSDNEGFGNVAQDYGRRMEQLGLESGADIFSSVHRDIATISKRHGAVYKPSGAGGGDLGIAFVRDDEQKTALSLAITKAGFDIIDLQHPDRGVHTVQLQKDSS